MLSRENIWKAELNGIENNYLILFITCTSQTNLKCLFIPKCELSTLIGLVGKKDTLQRSASKHLLIIRKDFQTILMCFITFSWENVLFFDNLINEFLVLLI